MKRLLLSALAALAVLGLGAAAPVWTSLEDGSNEGVCICGPSARPLWCLLREVPDVTAGAAPGAALGFYFWDVARVALLGQVASAAAVAVALLGRAPHSSSSSRTSVGP